MTATDADEGLAERKIDITEASKRNAQLVPITTEAGKGAAEVFLKCVRDYRQLTISQAGQYQVGAWKAAVFYLPADKFATDARRADLDLEGERLLVTQIAEQKLEAIAFNRRSQFDRASSKKCIQQLPARDLAPRQHERIIQALPQPDGTGLRRQGMIPMHH